MMSSLARSQTTAARGDVTSGELYSGCAWSTYRREPLVRTTLAARVVLVRELAGVGHPAPHLEAPGIAQGRLVGVVPRGMGGADALGRRVRVHDLPRQQHRVRCGVAGHRDAVLGLDAHHATHGHG